MGLAVIIKSIREVFRNYNANHSAELSQLDLWTYSGGPTRLRKVAENRGESDLLALVEQCIRTFDGLQSVTIYELNKKKELNSTVNLLVETLDTILRKYVEYHFVAYISSDTVEEFSSWCNDYGVDVVALKEDFGGIFYLCLFKSKADATLFATRWEQ